jgi:hypothetical protein
VVERQVERGGWASGAPAVSVTLHTSRPALTIAFFATDATVVAGGVTRIAEEWDTPSPDEASATLLAALEWGARATEV